MMCCHPSSVTLDKKAILTNEEHIQINEGLAVEKQMSGGSLDEKMCQFQVHLSICKKKK